jgi:hypothetical protein
MAKTVPWKLEGKHEVNRHDAVSRKALTQLQIALELFEVQRRILSSNLDDERAHVKKAQ